MQKKFVKIINAMYNYIIIIQPLPGHTTFAVVMTEVQTEAESSVTQSSMCFSVPLQFIP